MKLLLICLILAAPIAAPARDKQAQPELKIPGPAVQRNLLGRWSIRVKYTPTSAMPHGDVGVGEEIWGSGPGGLSLVEDYRETNSQHVITGLAVLWWDADAGKDRVLWCENTSSPGCKVLNGFGRGEGEHFVITATDVVDGKPTAIREVFSEIATDSFKQEFFSGPDEQRLVRLLTIQAKRVAPIAK